MSRLEDFEGLRDYLFAIAYRMLGMVMEAEDVVQEAYVRWEKVDVSDVESPKSYLAAVVTRLCLDQLKSARNRREEYIGPWLPEPLISDPAEGPAHSVALADSLSMAFLVLLESLQPEQRAVYLLREVFDFGYDEISEIVGKTEVACRQMVSRAKKYVEARRPRYSVSPEKSHQAVEQFMAAVDGGDLRGLMEVLDADVVWTSDGGGIPGVAKKPVEGADLVARFALRIAEIAPSGASRRSVVINGGPGVLIDVDGHLYGALAIDVDEGKIVAIRAIVNPDKLRHLVGDEV